MIYIVDTSAFVDWWTRYYPPKTFPTLRDKIDGLIADGRFRSSMSVLDELQKQDDDLAKWAKAHKADIFSEDTEEVQKLAIGMNDKYSFPDKKTKGISGADAFVIAHARNLKGEVCVISAEREKTEQNPKIPFVCAQHGVEHYSFIELVKMEDWKF